MLNYFFLIDKINLSNSLCQRKSTRHIGLCRNESNFLLNSRLISRTRMVECAASENGCHAGQPGGGNSEVQNATPDITVPGAIVSNQAVGTAEGYKAQAKYDGIPSR